MRLVDSLDSALIKLRGPSAKLALRALKRNGFNPRSILDIGAFEGKWTAMVLEIFPQARLLMIEAQADKRPKLDQLVAQYPDQVQAVIALLGDQPRPDVEFQIMEKGSSIFPEMTSAPRRKTLLSMRTCDEVVGDSSHGPFDMLKLDVQGAELAVLQGASQTLQNVEIIFMEVSVLPYNEGAPSFAEVVQFLDERGFVLFDIARTMRDPMDVLSQCDMMFVRRDSGLRQRRIDEQLTRHAVSGSD